MHPTYKHVIEVTMAAGSKLLVNTHEEAWVLCMKHPLPIRCRVLS